MLFRTLCLRGKEMALSTLIKSTSGRFIGSFSQSFSRVTVSVNIHDNNKVKKCKFHTTQRLHIPPKVVLLAGPLTLIGAPLFGWCCKKWWALRTSDEKETYRKRFAARKSIIYGTFGFLLAGLFLFCATHIETSPITGRSRFIGLNEEQQKHWAKISYKARLSMYQKSILHVGHPAHVRVQKVLDRVIEANRDVPLVTKRHWTLTVVDSPVKRIGTLPGGDVFVFLKALRDLENDDQLAVILAHEISHVLLQHTFEQISMKVVLCFLWAVPNTIMWAAFPVLVAILLEILAIGLTYLLVILPRSRMAETEADDIGIKLAAKACIDVREAVVFWKTMKVLSDLGIVRKVFPGVESHPRYEDRESNLSAQMDEAIALRVKSGCPPLSSPDPIASFNARTLKQHADRFKARGISKQY